MSLFRSPIGVIFTIGFCSSLSQGAYSCGATLDRFCQALNGPDSYCKSNLDPPVCQGGDQLCPCEREACDSSDQDEYCQALNGAASYCKFYQLEPVCQGGDQPCDCGSVSDDDDGDSDDNLTCEAFLVHPSFNGVCNDIDNPLDGAAEEFEIRLAPNDYLDGKDIKNTVNRLSPREISNTLCDQSLGPSGGNLKRSTTLLIFFGQFVDHDIALTLENDEERMDIEVPDDDPVFDSSVEFKRSVFSRKTEEGPREFRNVNTGYLDLSQVYGDSLERNNALRKFEGGLLLSVEQGTIDGERPLEFLPLNEDLPLGPVTLAMGDIVLGQRACGDRRCNEVLVLQALHTVWLRNHNRWARQLAEVHPDLSDDDLFHKARLRNIFEYQSIIFEEWLPVLLGPEVLRSLGSSLANEVEEDAGTRLEFANCAFRFGHSGIANSILVSKDREEEETSVPLSEAFFNVEFSDPLKNTKHIDELLNGSRVQEHEEIDERVVDGLRNTLFGNVRDPLDLPSINLQRGRDMGVPGIAEFRSCRSYDCFLDLTGDVEKATVLKELYSDDFEAVDCWIGGLLEPKFLDSHLGETFTKIILKQFLIYRNSDRFWYEEVLEAKPEEFEDLSLPAKMVDILKLNSATPIADHHPAFLAAPFYVSQLTSSVLRVEWTGFSLDYQELQGVEEWIVTLGSVKAVVPADTRGFVFDVQPSETYEVSLFWSGAGLGENLVSSIEVSSPPILPVAY